MANLPDTMENSLLDLLFRGTVAAAWGKKPTCHVQIIVI